MLAKEVLRSGSHVNPERALPQKDLRPAMAFVNRRAARIPGDSASESLLTEIVDRGMQEGWLKRFRRIPGKSGTEALYLVEAEITQRQLEDTSSRATQQPYPIAQRRESVVASPTAPPPASPPASPEASLGGIPSDSPLFEVPRSSPSIPERQGLQPDRSDSAPVKTAETSSPYPGKKHPNRASVFEKYLQDEKIGLMPDTRDYLFDAIEEVIDATGNGKPPAAVPAVFEEALTLAKKKAEDCGYTAEKNWTIAKRCALRLMLQAGVLTTDGNQPVPAGVGRDSTPLSGLTPGFRVTCIAYQLERVLYRAGYISHEDDLYYLGLTFYRRGKRDESRTVAAEDLKSKADALLAFLDSQGKIEEFRDEEGNLLVRLNSKAKVISAHAAD